MDFGLQVEKQLVRVNARVLPPPVMLYYSRNRQQSKVRVSNRQVRYERDTYFYIAAPNPLLGFY